MKKNIVGKNQKKNFAKQFKEVDALLNQLTSAKVVPKTKFYTEKINNEQQRLSQSPEINSYKRRLIQAISSKFYDASRYNGEICNLYIRLAPSGALISIETANNANSALCQAAISAAKMATIPKPPNMEVYEIFKNATLRFSPDQANELK
nr:cell envelope integrity protein TolA [Sodalis sp. CWE]